MLGKLQLLTILAFALLGDVAAEAKYELIKTGVECNSNDRALGNTPNSDYEPTVEDCAKACQKTAGCAFFIYGQDGVSDNPESMKKKNRCYAEFTKDATCTEGWETDFYDFYELKNPGVVGCLDPRAGNYNSTATVDSHNCTSYDTCAHRLGDGSCYNCYPNQCTEEISGVFNKGYKNHQNDTVHASQVDNGAIKVDGDLRDWENHLTSRTYKDVAFADASGKEVFVEMTKGGQWFGDEDFSIEWRMAWDDERFYLAADVTDELLVVPYSPPSGESICWVGGMQVGFEVGGPSSKHEGELQGLRSDSLDQSRLRLLNAGLKHGQSSCSTDAPDYKACCVDYALGGTGADQREENAANWLRKAKVAVLRNENNKRTVIEASFHREDLLGLKGAKRWRKGLSFGFSFIVNDGDNANDPQQQGWAGFYPHALVQGWNEGHKQPYKAGLVQLAGSEKMKHVEGGGGGGGFFTFVFGCLLGTGAVFGFLYARNREYWGAVDTVKERLGFAPKPRARVTMASQDSSQVGSFTAPVVPLSAPMDPSAGTQQYPSI